MEIYPILKMQVQLEEGGVESETEIGQYSLDGFGAQTARNPSPFSAKRIVHESDTPHTKPHQGSKRISISYVLNRKSTLLITNNKMLML